MPLRHPTTCCIATLLRERLARHCNLAASGGDHQTCGRASQSHFGHVPGAAGGQGWKDLDQNQRPRPGFADDLYAMWHDVESAPQWQEAIQQVVRTGPKISHWIMRSGDKAIEWDSEVLADEPGSDRLAQHEERFSLRDAGVVSAFRFRNSPHSSREASATQSQLKRHHFVCDHAEKQFQPRVERRYPIFFGFRNFSARSPYHKYGTS